MNSLHLSGRVVGDPYESQTLWIVRLRVRVQSGKYRRNDVIVTMNGPCPYKDGDDIVIVGEVTSFKGRDGTWRTSIRALPFMTGKPVKAEGSEQDDDDDPYANRERAKAEKVHVHPSIKCPGEERRCDWMEEGGEYCQFHKDLWL